jgi:hypothetical protein
MEADAREAATPCEGGNLAIVAGDPAAFDERGVDDEVGAFSKPWADACFESGGCHSSGERVSRDADGIVSGPPFVKR